MRKEYIEAGKIVTTHGVKGEVKLYPWCDDPEMFLDIETIYLDAKGQKPMTLEGVRFAKEMPLLKLEGIDCTALSNNSHIWTVATLDGTDYHIDTTWGDSGPAPNYDYFAMTAEESWQHHSW